MELHHADSLQKKKFRLLPTARKVMIMVFWDYEGVILLVVMQRKTTVKYNVYVSTLRKMGKRFHCL